MGKSSKLSHAIVISVLIAITILAILPFVMLVSISISNEQQVVEYGYSIIPRGIDFSAYKYVLQNPETNPSCLWCNGYLFSCSNGAGSAFHGYAGVSLIQARF